MSGGTSPPIISTPGPSRKGRQVMSSLRFRPAPATRTVSMGLGTDSRPGPPVAAQRTPRIEPEEDVLPPLTDPSGPSRPRKKARSESDRDSSSEKDKRPRIGPSSRSEGEESATTSSAHSSTESVTPSSSRSSSPSGSPIPVQPIPKPRAPARTGTAPRQVRSPPRSPSPTLSPIPVDSTRGAPALSGTAGNLDSTRYMDLESTRPQQATKPNPTPSTSYAAMAARPGWRPIRGPAQCHRCQAFGHASYNCHRAVRCVRCAGEHIVADCPRPRDGPFSCANCGKDHAAVDRRCAVFRKRARMMGATVPPPAPQAPRAGSAALPASIPVAKGKGKGKGKTSQPPPPSHSAPSAVVVEALPSAPTLMAQANPPRRINKPKPTPAPRGRTSAGISVPKPLPTSGPTSTKREKNKRKKAKRKTRKREERERLRGTSEPTVPEPQQTNTETMEVSEAPLTAQQPTSSQPLPTAHPAEG
ncbi:serine/arginine repetitive matrix protein 1-like [Bombyx mori]|uniref:serine/arginine repetitive matrix protein 1-like n=1 Tax=Bombyx mori TaxID=7091 RepID=UPI002ED0A1F6